MSLYMCRTKVNGHSCTFGYFHIGGFYLHRLFHDQTVSGDSKLIFLILHFSCFFLVFTFLFFQYTQKIIHYAKKCIIFYTENIKTKKSRRGYKGCLCTVRRPHAGRPKKDFKNLKIQKMNINKKIIYGKYEKEEKINNYKLVFNQN